MNARWIPILITVGCVGLSVKVSTAPIQILVASYVAQAAAGNFNPAYIVVHIAKADGTPNTKVELPKLSGDRVGGLELKGSKWRFQTLIVPPGYGRQFLSPGSTSPSFLNGEVRIVSVTPYGSNVEGGAAAGLYTLTVIPAVGFHGAAKVPNAWVAGNYNYMVSYIDGTDYGTAFGVLIIR